MRTSWMLTANQKHAAAALFGLALHQAQIHQSRPLGPPSSDHHYGVDTTTTIISYHMTTELTSKDPDSWLDPNSGILRPIFEFFEIESVAWLGIEQSAAAKPPKHHVGQFLRLLSEQSEKCSSEKKEQELDLAKGVDDMAARMEASSISKTRRDKHYEYKQERQEKCSVQDMSESNRPSTPAETEAIEFVEERRVTNDSVEDASHGSDYNLIEEPAEEQSTLSYERKIVVLYELLSASLATMSDDSKTSKQQKGYDARYRVALRLLATWLDVKWVKVASNDIFLWRRSYFSATRKKKFICPTLLALHDKEDTHIILFVTMIPLGFNRSLAKHNRSHEREAMEVTIASSVMALAKEEELKIEESKSERGSLEKWKRGGIIGAAAVTGGALMAITGGLAAPAIAAGFGALAPAMGAIIPVIGAGAFGAAASIAGSVVGSVAIAASFGAAGASLTGTKMARRIGSVDEFDFKAVGENHRQGRLAVEILVSGFVFDEEDFIMPWEGLVDNLERYVLIWESTHLIAISTAIQDWLKSRLAITLMKQGAMMTVLSTLVTALAWPATLLSVTDFIDSKWTIAIDRSDKAGKLLAEVLLKGLQGNRPVTLIGYSLGARVIFKCLEFLSKSDYKANIVERVVLLGAPIKIKDENWEAVRKIVAGRFVNVFSRHDWILGIAFRASLLTKGLAGIQAIDVPGIENVDASDIIEGHSSYLWSAQRILDQLDLDAYFPVFRSSST